MKHDRKYIIKVTPLVPTVKEGYIKYTFKNFLGYSFLKTRKIEKAHVWIYKKSCEKYTYRLTNELDPTKINIKGKYKFELIEITNNTILRYIKLKKLNSKLSKKTIL